MSPISGEVSSRQAQKTPGRGRLYVFRALTFGFPVLFFLLLEGGLRLLDYGQNLDLFVPVDTPGGARFMTTNPDVAARYFSRIARIPRPPSDVFLREKPVGGYRVFMMGGSTVAGFPYPENVLSSRILDRRLSDAFPDRHIEVVNLGMAAVNSFTLLDLADEILDYEPDAVLIYAGHNEFYGAFGAASVESPGNARWIVNGYLALLDFRIVRILRQVLYSLADFGPADGADYESTQPTLMSRVVGDAVDYGSDTYRTAENNFRKNLDALATTFLGAGVPVVFSELVSNVRDMPPFVSLVAEGQRAADAFAEARALELQGDYEASRVAYHRAKDLDAIRFRASEDFNSVIGQIARKHGIPVVPMKAYFEAASPNGLVGANLMLEHVHPNVEGYLLMADAFFETMRRHGFVAEEWDSTLIEPASYYAEHWPVTELDRALGRLRVMDLMDYWPFRPLSDPGDAFQTFQPRTPAEAIAYRVAKDQLDFVQAHLQMAQIHAASGDDEKSTLEHRALIAADPYEGR